MADAKLEEKILSEINLNRKSLQDGVQHLTEWLTKQPHLPNLTDEKLLTAFIVGSKSVERAKERLEKYLTARTKYPALYSSVVRDPTNIQWKQVEQMVVMPKLTADGCNVLWFQIPLTKQATEDFSFVETCKVFFMLLDSQFRSQPILAGQYVVIDSQGITVEYVSKFVTTITATVFDLYQNVMPIRLKALYVINASSVAEMFVNKIMKPFFSEKLRKRIHVYSEGISILSKHFPEEILLQDLGGKHPSTVQQLEDELKKSLDGERDWFMNEGCLGSDETRRPLPDTAVEQVRGTFRKLELD